MKKSNKTQVTRVPKLFILTSALLFSCTPIHYLSKPIYEYPGINLGNENEKSIIVAKDCSILKTEFNNCIDGFIPFANNYKSLQIAEIIDFDSKVDSLVLYQLRDEYNIDGLLLLTKINEEPLTKIMKEYSQACLDCPSNYSLDYELIITTTWEYFDFKTGKTFKYSVENSRKGKFFFSKHEDIGSLLSPIKDQLLIENGKICVTKLVGY